MGSWRVWLDTDSGRYTDRLVGKSDAIKIPIWHGFERGRLVVGQKKQLWGGVFQCTRRAFTSGASVLEAGQRTVTVLMMETRQTGRIPDGLGGGGGAGGYHVFTGNRL